MGIRDPRDPSQLIGAVPLVVGSAVTSGVYERCFTAPDGTFYHHILDPRTGRPVETDAAAGVTVICEKSIDAEGFSTTLLALGLERDSASPVDTPKFCRPFSSPRRHDHQRLAERAMVPLYRGEIVASSNRRRTLD